MKTLICTNPGELHYAEQEIPVSEKGRTLLKIRRIGICGTDLHAFEGTQPFFTYPRILGHELAAEIVESDGAPGFSPGEIVTFIPYFNCGNCIACRRGKPNCCTSLRVCGVHIDGGMAEYISVPSYTLVHGEGLGVDELALVELMSIGAHGIRRAAIEPAEYVLIIGAGPIGLGIIEFARIAGAQLIVMDINESRLNFCRQMLQVPHTINPKTEDVLEKLRSITAGDMPTVVIDATGSQAAINNALPYLAHGGRFVLVGLQKGPVSVSHPEFHKREATLMSSRNATREDFEHVISSMKSGKVKPLHYITHRVPFAAVKTSFSSWLNPDNGVIKAMVEV